MVCVHNYRLSSKIKTRGVQVEGLIYSPLVYSNVYATCSPASIYYFGSEYRSMNIAIGTHSEYLPSP